MAGAGETGAVHVTLRAFSVVGEALNFSSRRFETVLRVSLMPLVLLLVFNMAAAFGYLSVANGRVITFRDVAAYGASWDQVAKIAEKAAAQSLGAFSAPTWTIYLASLAITFILVSSFMAPLIRYAGLGEKPASGLLRIPFGPDQWRFAAASLFSFLLSAIVVYAPIAVATFVIIGLVVKAMSAPYAHFPDADSLHTMDIITGREALALRGDLWLYDYGYWGGAAAAIAALLAFVLILQVRPRGEDKTAGIGILGRCLGVVASLAIYFGSAGFLAMKYAAATTADSSSPILAISLFAAAAIAAAAFFNLRLYPYVGVAVCRRSMAFAETFRATRRYNVFRLGLAVALLAVLVGLAQYLLVEIGLGQIHRVLAYLAAAVESYVRLIAGSEAGGWVRPFFGWLWALTGIVFTILWTAFTYGVSAGLWGRLYRESER